MGLLIKFIFGFFKRRRKVTKVLAPVPTTTTFESPTSMPDYGRNQFDVCIPFILKVEGGYVNDPDDSGGETKFGISKRANPDVDIENLTVEAAQDIYFEKYWKIAKCWQLPWPKNIIVFDFAVNSGVGAAARFIESHGNKSYLAMIDARRSYYETLIQIKPKLKKYRRGWQNRLSDLSEFIKVTSSLYNIVLKD